MSRPPRVTAVSHMGEQRVRLTFSDGLVRELDLAPVLDGPILDTVNDADTFAQVFVDRVAGTIAWPNGVDLDPDVLHGDAVPASGQGPALLREYRVRASR